VTTATPATLDFRAAAAAMKAVQTRCPQVARQVCAARFEQCQAAALYHRKASCWPVICQCPRARGCGLCSSAITGRIGPSRCTLKNSPRLDSQDFGRGRWALSYAS
jgi:hypothetical protein